MIKALTYTANINNESNECFFLQKKALRTEPVLGNSPDSNTNQPLKQMSSTVDTLKSEYCPKHSVQFS